MAKAKKVVGEYNVWRHSYDLLDWLSGSLPHRGGTGEWAVGASWWVWWVDANGAEQVQPMNAHQLVERQQYGWVPLPSLVIGGTLHGLGVWTPGGGALRISVYVPPHWPTVRGDDGKERTVIVSLHPDDAIARLVGRDPSGRPLSASPTGDGD